MEILLDNITANQLLITLAIVYILLSLTIVFSKKILLREKIVLLILTYLVPIIGLLVSLIWIVVYKSRTTILQHQT